MINFKSQNLFKLGLRTTEATLSNPVSLFLSRLRRHNYDVDEWSLKRK